MMGTSMKPMNSRTRSPEQIAAAGMARLKRLEGEAWLEQKLVETLEKRGVEYQRQVRTVCGIADVVTDDTVYEVKVALTLDILFKAVGQVSMYAEALGRNRRVIAGHRVKGMDDVYAVVRRLGVEINVVP